ncbi:MAG: GntR family transcriptional regulator [Acidobacteriota bacterium]|jgi:GntR family transcriptional regulator|nr:GntR family transcriptional regulator [Acidobacteriota bacterium]
MRLWLSKNSEVALHEQLTTQIVLGVVSGDLKAGQRLPSTRELARRFKVHANTVSAAYRDLEDRGWLESRKGSGVYVRAQALEAPVDSEFALDQLISTFLRVARERGHTLGEIQQRVKQWLELQSPDHFLVIETDAELRAILSAEIKEATGFDVRGATPEEIERAGVPAGASPLALYGQAERVRAILPPDTNLIILRSRSVPLSLTGEERPAPDALITVASRWEDFLRWSRSILVAAGLDPAALNFRDAREEGWQRGINSSALVITDVLTANELPPNSPPARVFRVVADSSLAELRAFVENFLTR